MSSRTMSLKKFLSKKKSKGKSIAKDDTIIPNVTTTPTPKPEVQDAEGEYSMDDPHFKDAEDEKFPSYESDGDYQDAEIEFMNANMDDDADLEGDNNAERVGNEVMQEETNLIVTDVKVVEKTKKKKKKVKKKEHKKKKRREEKEGKVKDKIVEEKNEEKGDEKIEEKYEDKTSNITIVVKEKDDDDAEDGAISSEYSNENDFIGDFEFNNDMDNGDVDFTCLSPEQIVSVQKKQITETAELLHVSPSVAGKLLRHFQWKTEKLLSLFFENPSKVWQEVGYDPDSDDNNKEHKLKGKGECLVCCDEFKSSECTALKCKHRFCNDCWNGYLSLKIKEGEVQKLHCPARDCNVPVPEETVKKVVDEEVYEKFIRFITKSFVEDNSQVSWCPAPNCGNAITADMMIGATVQCSCGYRFCFTCHNEAHEPAPCERVRHWQKKCVDESETGHWVSANTKDCPKCHIAVEKNGGCNHMTCRQCTYEWCWFCLKIWKGHNDYYTCTRYEKIQKKNKNKKKKSKIELLEEKKEEERLALDRYLSHFHRYLVFEQHIKQSKEISDRAKEKIKQLSAQSTLADVKYIEHGINIVLQCFLVMKYSYVQSYYMIEDDILIKKESLNLNQEKEKKKKRKFFEKKKKSVITPNVNAVLKEYDPKQQNLSIGFFIFLLDELEKNVLELFDHLEKISSHDPEEKKVITYLCHCAENRKNNILQASQLFEEGLYNLTDESRNESTTDL